MKKIIGFSILAILLIAFIVVTTIAIKAEWWQVLCFIAVVAGIVSLIIFAAKLIAEE